MNCEYNAERHEYRHDNSIVLSVTQVMSECRLTDLSGIPQDVLKQAAERGTYVHSCCELLDGSELDEDMVHAEAIGYVRAYKAWKELSGFKPLKWGKPRIAEVLAMKYGMTEDITGHIGEKFCVVDLKTTKQIYDSVPIQLAAYAAGLRSVGTEGGLVHSGTIGDSPSIHRLAVQLFADGTFEQHIFDDPNDEYIWLACLSIVTWKENRRRK